MGISHTTTHSPSTLPSLPGKLLSFEGIDGAGSTTQAKTLAKRLRRVGFDVLETREPGGTPMAEAIRTLILQRNGYPDEVLHPQTELLLFLAARKQHIQHCLLPALQKKQVVICDRFHDSTLAYQVHGRKLNLTPLQGWIEEEVHALCRPALTFWLDVRGDTAKTRRQTRRATNVVAHQEVLHNGDNAPFLQRVHQGYALLQQHSPKRIVRIEANTKVDVVEKAIWKTLEKHFDLAVST